MPTITYSSVLAEISDHSDFGNLIITSRLDAGGNRVFLAYNIHNTPTPISIYGITEFMSFDDIISILMDNAYTENHELTTEAIKIGRTQTLKRYNYEITIGYQDGAYEITVKNLVDSSRSFTKHVENNRKKAYAEFYRIIKSLTGLTTIQTRKIFEEQSK